MNLIAGYCQRTLKPPLSEKSTFLHSLNGGIRTSSRYVMNMQVYNTAKRFKNCLLPSLETDELLHAENTVI